MEINFYEKGFDIKIVIYINPTTIKEYKINIEPEYFSVYKKDVFVETIYFYKKVEHISTIFEENKIIINVKKDKNILWRTITGPIKNSSEDTKIINDDDGDNGYEEPTDLMSILKKIYSKGNPDVKSAMDKSILDSNGTVLSTNWDEVKNACYDDNKE